MRTEHFNMRYVHKTYCAGGGGIARIFLVFLGIFTIGDFYE